MLFIQECKFYVFDIAVRQQTRLMELGAAISEVRGHLAHVREQAAARNGDDDDENPARRPRVKLTPAREIRSSLLALAAQANNPNAAQSIVQPSSPKIASGLHEFARETSESWGGSSVASTGESELARRL